MLARFYRYSEYPWYIRSLMLAGYLECWGVLVLSALLVMVIPSIPGYKTMLLSVLIGSYVYVLFKIRKELSIEPEDTLEIKVDEATTKVLERSLKDLM